MTTNEPAYIDYSGQITHVRTESEEERALSEVANAVVHYEAGGAVSADLTQAQEEAHIQSVAAFHQSPAKDFGGGWHGRTIEYTYGIFPSGRIYLLNRESLVTWSHRNGNRVGMATVLFIGVGQQPSPAMVATLYAHLDYLTSRSDLRIIKQRVWGHGETNLVYGGGPLWGNSTDCPGEALATVKGYREEAGMPDTTTATFYKETGHSIGGAIRDYWTQGGGLAEFGFPLGEEAAGDSMPFSALPELAGYTCQAFERAVLLWKAGGVVQRARVGALALALCNGVGGSCCE